VLRNSGTTNNGYYDYYIYAKWRNTMRKLLAAAFGFALAFTFSCSSDSEDEPNSGPSEPSGEQASYFQDSRDDKKYKFVEIGSQTWMAENLNYDALGSVEHNQGAYRLYNFPESSICPDGWHLPSDDEWTELTDFVGENAGTKLKSKNYNGTDDYGFAAEPIYNTGWLGWWSATIWEVEGRTYASIWKVITDDSNVTNGVNLFEKLNAVRCVRDD